MAEADLHPARVCTKCLVEKPETPEFFPRWKDGLRGLVRQCRECRNAYFKARYENDPEPAKGRAQAKHAAKPKRYGPAVPKGMKVCTSCYAMKPATAEFFVKDSPKKGARLVSPCRACNNAKSLRQKKLNPGKVRAQAEAYRERGRQKSREWRKANPERYAAICKANYHRRRKVVAGQIGFTADDVQRQKASQGNRCWWCQKKLDRFEVDHRFPVSKGGSNAADNIVISCKPCNRSKSARMPWEIDNPRLL